MSKQFLFAIGLWTVTGLWAATTPAAAAGEIGYIEDFALASDRAVAIQQLIPGSEDYYYYQCLHLQQTQQFEKADELLKQWILRYGRGPRVIEAQLRQSLLTYERNPQQSLETIRQQLQLEFNHQRESLGENPNLPTELDNQLISREQLTIKAFKALDPVDERVAVDSIDGFEQAALDWLISRPLKADLRRRLLQRLQRPDYAALPKLVVEDLKHANSGGFGSLPIHRQLLLTQLDECLRLFPDLLNQQQFVQIYVAKLAPNADVDWRRNLEEREAYLDRLWAFVSRLAPAHNSLKAHVLYHRLAHDREQGLYDRGRFLTYIALPRNAGYLAKSFVELPEYRRFAADLNADYASVTNLPPVGNDEPLVRDYLHHFLIDENSTKPYEPYINDVYLRQNFAEVKIVNGLGNAEQWYSLLSPERYQALKERIDIDFAPTNRRQFAADEPVSLDLFVKNVSTLIVKVFEINTRNFYRQNLREVNTDINLDGLVANEEQTLEYPEPPLRRVRRHFEFPTLARPGVYVIDFIGNGMSSRVVVRKGSLRHLVRTSVAGHVFTILDDRNQVVKDATLWFAGHEYTAVQGQEDKSGRIVVPFTDKPGPQHIVLSRAGSNLCSLDTFQHQSENYGLVAGIHIDRESLLSRKTAEVIVRPSLSLNGIPATLAVLEDVRLLIQSQDLDGVSTTKEVTPFTLFEDREATFEFQTPPRLASITFTLTAKVKNLSQNKKIDLVANDTFSLNSIDKSDKIEDLYLARFDGRYALDLLGKTGEPKPARPVQLQLKHRDFREPVQVTLQSDPFGRVQLGPLVDIESLTATGPEGTAHTWRIQPDQRTYRDSIHGLAGTAMEVGWVAKSPPLKDAVVEKTPQRSQVSLLEVRGGMFVSDRFANLSLENGLLVVKNLSPGDYDLWLKGPDRHITLRITEGEQHEAYAIGSARQLEMRETKPLQIVAVETEKDSLRVRLQNATKLTRVHLFATRYVPDYDPFRDLGRVADAELLQSIRTLPDTLYAAGRNIGDEYRYILDRKSAKKYPGVMIERPSVLLNPWAVRTTQTGKQEAQAGGDFAATPAAPRSTVPPPSEAAGLAERAAAPIESNLDFLGEASVVLTNLVPDEHGIIVIPRKELGAHQHIHVVAVDRFATVYRSVSLPESPMKFRDLRLVKGLDPGKHFTQQKRSTIVVAGEKFELADIVTSKFEAYDSLPRVYALYTTLSRDPKLAEFGFLMNWPKLKPEEKQTQYSKFACHELNFFLFRKDPAFFAAVVRPYLANKRDTTFLDRWLLGSPLVADLEPWNYEQLNIVERILLSQRIAGDAEHGKRHVRDLFDLVPPDPERSNLLFRTAIRGSALETSDQLGLGDAVRGINGKSDSYWFGRTAGEMRAGGALGGMLPQLAAPQLAIEPEAKPSDATAAEAREELKLTESLDKQTRARRLATVRDQASGISQLDRFGAEARKKVRQLFEQVDKTQEWAENNYFKLPIEQQNASLVTVNTFWRDYAAHDPTGDRPFYSTNFPDASHNFTEMMFALALLDLPFEAGKHASKFEQASMSLQAASPMVVFHEELREATGKLEQTPILISQNFFQANDRYRHENNEQLDKFVADEFLVHTVYGCQTVVTNPTSSPQKLDVLVQIPVGAIVVSGGEATRGLNVPLQPFSTQTIEYFFYFPAAGKYPHYPVHVSKNEQLVASATPVTLTVVERLSRIDRESWEYISQRGTNEEVVTFLRTANLQRIHLEKIAFRMQDGKFFLTVVELLSQRHAYNHTLWSYAIKHNSVPAIREFLRHANEFVARCGESLVSPLLRIDPVARKTFQQLDYLPLVNARVHQLGRRRQIVNDRFEEQYNRLLKVLSYQRALTDGDRLAVTYYLLLQDRIEEASRFFQQVHAEQLATRLQYDYFATYLSLCHEDLATAEQIAAKYANYPVDRWRNAFSIVAKQIEEARGAATEVLDPENRVQVQTQLAATEPTLEFQVDAKQVTVRYQNLDRVTVNYYLMDIELLFSRNPFVQTQSGQFAHIRPNQSQQLDLPKGRSSLTFPLPEKLQQSNILIEITGAGQIKSQPYFANSLSVQVQENYGQLRVVTANPGKPLPKVYVKAYARMKDGSVRFYKDGYTDLRGRFEYATLNTNELDFVDRFALLILSDDRGAMVREAGRPQQ